MQNITSNGRRIAALALILIMVLMLGSVISQPMGFAQSSFMPIALAAPGDGTSGAGGIDDISINDDGTVTFGGGEANVTNVLAKGKTIIQTILSVCSMVCLGFLILSIVKLAGSGDNDQARRKAMGGIITTGIGIALLGSLTIWYSFFYTAIK